MRGFCCSLVDYEDVSDDIVPTPTIFDSDVCALIVKTVSVNGNAFAAVEYR